MKFTFSNLPALGWILPVRRISDLARLCEETGFDRFAIADFPYHYDCVSVMTACLLATDRLEVESLVTNPYTRLPGFTAAAWATMADLSDGRAILGLGGGVESASQVWVGPWGLERPHPAQAVREVVDICRRMWAGEEVTREGEAVITISRAALKCPPPVSIPVLIAARGPVMLRLAGEIADVAHMASLFLDVEHQHDNIRLIHEGASNGGRSENLEIDMSLTVSISRDAQRARRAAKRTAAQTILWMAGADRFAQKRTDWKRPPQFDVPESLIHALATTWDMWKSPALPDELAAMISDDLLDRFCVAGGPDECAERIRTLCSSLPEVTGLRVKMPPPIGAEAYENYQETILLMGDVIASINHKS